MKGIILAGLVLVSLCGCCSRCSKPKDEKPAELKTELKSEPAIYREEIKNPRRFEREDSYQYENVQPKNRTGKISLKTGLWFR